MIIRKTAVVILIILLCCLMAGCSAVNKASGAPVINQFRENPELQIEPGAAEHFIACADVYQTETGVDPKAWGTQGDDYLRQLIIKYKLDGLKIKLEPNQLKEVFLLLAKLCLLNQISR